MIRKLLLLAAAAWLLSSTAGTAKSRSTEDRLNTAMPRIPWPQPYDGAAANNSYGPSNNSYGAGDSSYPIGSGTDGIGGTDTGWSGWPAGGAPVSHYHSIDHQHYYGNLAGDFNALQGSHNSLVGAFQNHITDYGYLQLTVGTLRNDHSNLLNAHNLLMYRLNSSNILQ